MGLKTFIQTFFKKVNNKPVEVSPCDNQAHFDSGLHVLPIVLRSGDYYWSERISHKKVILCNPKDCDKLTIWTVVSAWGGTGHLEWDFLLAGWFINAIQTALEAETEADISMLFCRDLFARNDKVYTSEQVYEHLLPSFEIIEENEKELRLNLKIG